MSLMTKEQHFCKSCRCKTTHTVVLVRNKSPFEHSKRRKLKEFIAGFIKGWAVGPLLAAMDDFSRHIICESCGNKEVENQ